MTNADANRKPTFFWQGVLLVMPVTILAGVGFLSLRQERLLAQHEASERAQVLADELAPKGWRALDGGLSSERCQFETDSHGQLISPLPYSSLPVPRALDLAGLSPEQADLWRSAREAELSGLGAKPAIEAYGKLLALQPPGEFRAIARYSLGLLQAKEGQATTASRQLLALLQDQPNAVGESGLPLRPLAQIKLLDLDRSLPRGSAKMVTLETLCSNAVFQPSPISLQVLRLAEDRAQTAEDQQLVRTWRIRWEDQELSRVLYQVVRRHLQSSREAVGAGSDSGALTQRVERVFWVTSPTPWTRSIQPSTEPGSKTAPPPEVAVEGSDWLVVAAALNGGHWQYYCLGESEVGARLSTTLESARRLPDYFGIGFELAGRRLTWSVPDLRSWHEVNYFGRRGGGQKKELLDQQASTILASATAPQDSGEQLRVNVYLTSPSALYQRQYARTFWVACLVGAASLAAVAGFAAAYRAFNRQLRLSELKSNFVSSVSHELRAPIASVRLMAESLERGKVSDSTRQQEYFRFIVQECRRLSALIENVLDFSRIEQGRKEYEFEPTDLAALLHQTVKLMEPYAAERQVTLTLEIPECHVTGAQVPIVIDGKATQQAVINLIDNAIKHSPKGQTVRIGLEATSEMANPDADFSGNPSGPPGSALYQDIWVEDKGAGIPPADHEKIFERFYRRGSELRRETSGVGIGLNIVKHIVEAHGGRVLIRSDIGQGSRFTIHLPMGVKPNRT
jgi:signal transduction histidine kinase